MLGVIWTMQLLHYPSFHFVSKANYRSFQEFHIKRITFIVAPAMLIEAISGSLCLIYIIDDIENFFVISLILLVVIWLMTAFIFSKLHQNLLDGYSKIIINKLIRLNWIRSLLWSFRFALLIINEL